MPHMKVSMWESLIRVMKPQLRVGIVGSRRRCSLTDRKIVFNLVEKIVVNNPHRDVVIVSGACRLGADNFAAEASRIYKLKLVEYPVVPGTYGERWEFAKAAFARNKSIAENSDVGFALVHQDRKGGTENTIHHYHDLKKKIYLVDESGRTYLSSIEEKNFSDVTQDPDKDRNSST